MELEVLSFFHPVLGLISAHNGTQSIKLMLTFLTLLLKVQINGLSGGK